MLYLFYYLYVLCLIVIIIGRQLLTDAEPFDGSDDENSTDAEEAIDEPSQKKSKIWSKCELTASPIDGYSFEDMPFDHSMSPYECFRLFVDDNVVELLRRFTNLYATQNGKVLNATFDEMIVFLGIHYFSGYHVLPYKELYWNMSPDMDTTIIRKTMTRDRFRDINQNVHLSNNERLHPNDKFAKVAPIASMLRSNFQKYSVPQQNVSIDEAMIKYYGRHGCKQYIRGKPIRFGYKAWCLNLVSGYLIDFDFYQGKSSTLPVTSLGVGGSVIKNLVSRLPGRGYHVFCDRFFTSLKLVEEMGVEGIGITGTIQRNRMGDCPLRHECELVKNRGDFDYLKNNTNLVCVWKDNATVSLCTNTSSVYPIGKASRYSSAQHRRIEIDQPNLVRQYNKNMGGTDQMDNNVATYKISMRGKKWWHSLFTWLFDVSMSNAWMIFRHRQHSKKQLDFRREVVQEIFQRHGAGKSLSADSGKYRSIPSLRFDHKDHWIVPVASQLRCALETCKARPKSKCLKCNVGLCVKCFYDYHK